MGHVRLKLGRQYGLTAYHNSIQCIPMANKPGPKGDHEMVKTTLRLSAEVWRKARVRALDERVSFQEIVERALKQYLGSRS